MKNGCAGCLVVFLGLFVLSLIGHFLSWVTGHDAEVAERKRVAVPQPVAPVATAAVATPPRSVGPQPEVAVTADEMAIDRTQNEIRFDGKYKGKLIQVTGIVTTVKNAMFGQQFVTVKGTGEYDLVCYCASKERPTLQKLSPGDTVTLVGRFDRTMLSSIWMTDCHIVSPGLSDATASASLKPGSTDSKLTAFLQLVEKYKQSPKDPLTADSERLRFIKELEPLQEDFLKIPFEPKMNPTEARKMIDIFQHTIYRKHSGYLYNVFEAQMLEMTAEFVDR